MAEPATERRKPGLCQVGAASARARRPFRFRDGNGRLCQPDSGPQPYLQVIRGLLVVATHWLAAFIPPFGLPAEIAEVFLDAPDFALEDR